MGIDLDCDFGRFWLVWKGWKSTDPATGPAEYAKKSFDMIRGRGAQAPPLGIRYGSTLAPCIALARRLWARGCRVVGASGGRRVRALVVA